MSKEENILKTIIEKESWEELIYYVVGEEKIDPWDVDISKLVYGFLKFLRKAKELDFRIPAKIVFVASILLRMKAEQLLYQPKEEKAAELIELEIPLEEIEVAYPIKKRVKRPITIEELISAVRKAMEIKEKKKAREFFERDIIRREIEVRIEEEDIEQKIEKVFTKIKKLEQEMKEVPFSKLVGRWERDSVVDNFVPVLHLEAKDKVRSKQEKPFAEIYLKALE